MNINDYISYYGDYLFSDKCFNEVDNVIFSMLSYVDLSNIVSCNRKNKQTLSEVANEYFKLHNKKDINILEVRNAIKLLNKIKNIKRYKDVLVYNYRYIANENSQFCAVTFEISSSLCYVAFEGTDQLVSGWKEDCQMAYKFPVEAHVHSIKYLNDNFTFLNKKLIIGGHSKGGNLALVSSMYCNYFVRKKIINIYNNDGQGLRKEQLESRNYEKIKKLYIHIIPHNSIIGLLLYHDDDYTVIKSSKLGILAHDAFTWRVELDHFKRGKLNKFSQILDDGMIKWISKYDDNQKEKFINCIFELLKENNVVTLIQLKQDKNLIFQILKSSENLDPIVETMIKDLFKIVHESNLEKLLT